MEILHPSTIEEALAAAGGDEDTYLVAGGTLMQLDWALGMRLTDRLVSLWRIPGLTGVEERHDQVRIGALTTLSALERDPVVVRRLPMLHAALRVTAAPTIRNLGTIGGNIGGRRGCLIPALLALDAELELARTGMRQRVRLADWLANPRDPDCIIEAAVLPSLPQPERWVYRKVGLRAGFTPGMVNVAGRVVTSGGRVTACRLAVGGGSLAARQLHEAAALLIGERLETLDWRRVRAALTEAIGAPEDDYRTTAYRRRVAVNALVHGLGGGLPDGLPQRRRPVPAVLRPVTGEVALGRGRSGARWHVRPDGPDKIAGRLAYLTDVRGEDMLVARILRAGLPHARIRAIDTSQAEALPGVAAVVTHRDVKGLNGFGIVVQDQPALCSDKVRYIGDAVAAVAAVNAAVAERALSLIKVDYEALPVVSDAEEALLPGAEPVHAQGNLQRELHFSTGDVAAGFERAAHVVEATYVTPRQMHGFMETEGGYAFLDENGILNVLAGGQHGQRDRLQLSRILGLPEKRIRVVIGPTGGAFGGKDELTVQPALALLALKTGRRVRIQLDRAESVSAGTKSSPMRIRMRTACDAEGRLLAQDVDVVADAGAYASLSPGVVETALEHACGPYDVSNVRTHGRLAYTNNGTCGALRGFGCNQMTFALESQIDRLAEACGLDPVAIRARNLRRPRTPGPLGQVVAPTERLQEMLAAAAADPIWAKPRGLSADASEIVGVGMAMNYQGNGLGTLPPDPGGGILRLASDGKIEAVYGLTEIGQGLHAAIRNTVAAELGCGHDDIRLVTGDTGLTPESGSTTASRGTYVVWRVARQGAPRLAGEVAAVGAGLLGRSPESLAVAPGGLVERGSNSGDVLISFAEIARRADPDHLPCVEVAFEFPKSDYFDGNARLIFTFGSTLARVAIDRVTGQVRVLDISQHTSAGPVLDHASYLGQIEGASVQGMGFATMENAILHQGKYSTWNFDTYMMPAIQDAPESISVSALEDLEADDGYGPRGIGELGIGAIAPAIANAVADAIGYWPECAPIEPEHILKALAKAT